MEKKTFNFFKDLTFPDFRNPDTWMLTAALVYVVLPIILFFLGWIKLPIALLFSAAMIFLVLKVLDNFKMTDPSLFCKENRSYWIFTFGVILFWTYCSGIGGFVFQNSDYWVRNPIFYDLSTMKWPVVYDLSSQSATVQSIAGSDTVAFSYYFAWWLPVAGLSKLLSLSTFARNLLLLLWAAAGMMLIVYCLNRIIGKCSHVITAILIFFSGLDVVIYYLQNTKLPFGQHIEWWATFFQYSANTTQLFWVFNQSIPLWLIVCLFMLLKNNRYSAGICSLAFAYSPWATFGMVPYALSSTFNRKESLKNAINSANILVPLFMLITYGTFYTASSGSQGGYGLIFSLHPNQEKRIIFTYLLFILIEFGIYYIVAGKFFKKYEYYYATLIQLILFPLFYIRDFNFSMRGCIPALFVTMIFVIRFVMEHSEDAVHKLRKRIMIIILVIGSLTPFSEMVRTMKFTLASNDFTQDQIYSFNDMQTDETHRISTAKSQFFIYDYEEAVFFKYLGK